MDRTRLATKYLRWVTLLSLVSLAGCSSFLPHRLKLSQTCKVSIVDTGHVTEPSECADAAQELVSDQVSGRQFQIAFIEFTDQGWLHDRRQMEDALRPFEHASGKVQVVTYIHGWQHDARASDPDIALFRDKILPAFARSVDSETKTFGLFISWRGESSEMPGLRYLTFYDRKFTAEHVARGSVRELISRLRAFHDRGKRQADDVKVVLIGHSFGGLVLYNAIAESLIDHLVRTPPGQTPAPVADLAVVINPAFEASRFEPTFQVAMHHTPFPTGRPLFVSITADNDRATKYAFPLGRWVNSALEHESWTSEDLGPTPQRPDCDLSDDRRECLPYGRNWRLEKVANTNTMGHIERYFTHQLSAAPATEASADQAARPVVCRPVAVPAEVAGSKMAARPQAPSPQSAFPLWTMQAKPPVVDGHGGIDNPALWKFLADLSMPQTAPDTLCPTESSPP